MKNYHIGQSEIHIHGVGGDLMIIVPAEKLAAAVNKHLLPGLIRNVVQQQKSETVLSKVSGQK
ncbi:hypothetical protein H7T43_09185 [Peribacillus simplex]|nr:hypothetical protein [Peribacillus simplex]